MGDYETKMLKTMPFEYLFYILLLFITRYSNSEDISEYVQRMNTVSYIQ